MTKTKNYVWMLQNKFTGVIQETYTYKTRASARKAVKSTSGRFSDFKPVMVSNTQLHKFVKSTETGKVMKTTMTLKPSKCLRRTWYPIAKSRYIV